MPPIGNISDSFNTYGLNAALWTEFTAGGALVRYDPSGVTVLYPSASTSTTDGDISSDFNYNLIGSSVYMQVLAVPSAATSADAELRVRLSSTYWIRFVYEGGTLFAQRQVKGNTVSLKTAPYNS